MRQSNHIISYLTLAVENLELMEDFYTGLGFALHSKSKDIDHPYAMYKSGALILALYPKELLEKQSGCSIKDFEGNNSIALSLNVKDKDKVDDYLILAESLNAQITRKGFEPVWGGYCAYFKDPENNLWEITWHQKFIFER